MRYVTFLHSEQRYDIKKIYRFLVYTPWKVGSSLSAVEWIKEEKEIFLGWFMPQHLETPRELGIQLGPSTLTIRVDSGFVDDGPKVSLKILSTFFVQDWAWVSYQRLTQENPFFTPFLSTQQLNPLHLIYAVHTLIFFIPISLVVGFQNSDEGGQIF